MLTSRQHQNLKEKAIPMKRKYRQKMKDERESLRLQVDELGTKLLRIQASQATPTVDLNPYVWKSVAMSQMGLRLVADAQQRQLKEAVTQQSALIRELSSMIKQGLANSAPENLVLGNSVVESTAVFRAFISELDSMYAKTDEVFQDLTLQASMPVMYDLAWKWTNGVQYVDSATSMLLPFDFEQTCSAMLSPKVTILPSSDEFDGITLVKKFLDHRRESLTVYYVVRTYREANRLVIVWRALAEGVGDNSGLFADEVGWFVVRPATTSTATTTATFLECYARLVPIRLNVDSQVGKDAFTKILAKCAMGDMSEMVESLEDLLLNREPPTLKG